VGITSGSISPPGSPRFRPTIAFRARRVIEGTCDLHARLAALFDSS
jgi:hypothetical protein